MLKTNFCFRQVFTYDRHVRMWEGRVRNLAAARARSQAHRVNMEQLLQQVANEVPVHDPPFGDLQHSEG